MRTPSRNMPKYSFEESNNITMIILYMILMFMLYHLLYAIYQEPLQGLSIIGVILIIGIIASEVEERKLRNLALDRKGEDIGTFARSFEFRKVDTWVIRAVYEELLEYRYFKGGVCPIRSSDKVVDDLGIDDEISEIFDVVIQRTNRTVDNIELNPYYNTLSTVKDLVLLLDYQPRLERLN